MTGLMSVGQNSLFWYLTFEFFRNVLHKYVNEDVSLGSWFIGLDVEHIDDRRLCCGTPPGNFIVYMLIIRVSIPHQLDTVSSDSIYVGVCYLTLLKRKSTTQRISQYECFVSCECRL